jgi:hypothetical protein
VNKESPHLLLKIGDHYQQLMNLENEIDDSQVGKR